MAWFHDLFWTSTLDVAKQLSAKHRHIIVPEEFVDKREEFFPMKQAKQLTACQITAFVLPKDQIQVLPIEVLKDTETNVFHCVFANEVFVIYSALKEDPECDESSRQHIGVFLENRERLLNAWRESGEEQEKLPYLLDTQKNRIFRTMFPHKNYVTELFRGLEQEPRVLQREVVKYCVKEVRIELSAFCNRSCQYCPVSFLERKDKSKKLPREILERCVEDLKEIDFNGQIWFCLFNEPLYDKKYLFETLEYVSKQLPKSYIKIVSNGDYLDEQYFLELQKYKLDELTISVHYDGKWNIETQKQKIHQMIQRIGIEEKGLWEEGEDRLIFQVDENAYPSNNLKNFSFRSEDFDVHGMDRAGALESGILRLENMDHCDVIVTQFNISYDGTVVPCCNMCSDIVDVKRWSYGKITKYKGIFEAYTSQKAASFRKIMFAPRDTIEQTPELCRTCSVAEYDRNSKVHRSDDTYRTELYKAWFKG